MNYNINKIFCFSDFYSNSIIFIHFYSHLIFHAFNNNEYLYNSCRVVTYTECSVFMLLVCYCIHSFIQTRIIPMHDNKWIPIVLAVTLIPRNFELFILWNFCKILQILFIIYKYSLIFAWSCDDEFIICVQNYLPMIMRWFEI